MNKSGMKFTVAIDGPAAAGKGSIARAIAGHFGFAHLDSGLLYRAVAKKVLAGADPAAAARALVQADLDDDGLRSAAVSAKSSEVATIPEVRAALVDFQREFAARDGGAVLDGRDIGTVICPAAEVKIFVTAKPEVRAERRRAELAERGDLAKYDTVLADVRSRDARDRTRPMSPLLAAADAHLLDTSALTLDEAVKAAIRIVQVSLGQDGREFDSV